MRFRTLHLAIAFWTGVAQADDSLFRERVAPILEAKCVSCHEGSKPKGGLSFASLKQFRDGGDSGPVVVAGKPDESLLFGYISGDDPLMPQDGDPLSAAEVKSIREWIADGAPWPEGVELFDKRKQDLNWWSLRPLIRPTPPDVDSDWIRTPIDAFVLAKHVDEFLRNSNSAVRRGGLPLRVDADRRTLIRRLYFDLIGLPPPYDEVEAYVADSDPQAYEKLVDRLLASPHYGERWGRHWLDVAHYGDSHGYDKDKLRPNAWPYRDYVIRAFNEDKPYSRFVEEQVAGDVLYPGIADGIIATGFLVAGPFDFVGQIEVAEGTLSKAITRNLDRDDMASTTIATFNSMTAHCARCHNHKFDPITQEDYYSLQAVFAGIDRADRPIPEPSPSGRGQKDLEPSPSGRGQGEGALSSTESPSPNGRGAPQLVFAAAAHFEPQGQFIPTKGKPRALHVLKRGNEKDLGDEVGPGTCGYLPELGSRFDIDPKADEGERRAALARWLVDKGNPLTWRSIVNRVWQYHFGRGIVDSPNDFGRMGALPTHPELLDWLAADFRDGSQSIKQLHRLICTSAVYRQASNGSDAHDKLDGANQYLWRMNRRKLEAETVRDSVLAVAGKLDPTQGGSGYRAFGFTDDHSPRYDYESYDPDDPHSHRRSVYRLIVRSVPDPFMATLDCADASALVAKRNETVTPLQSLALLNNKFMVRMAEHFAQRITPLGATNADRLRSAWRLALSREPSEDELAKLVAYADRHGLANACRLIFNMNEFVFVD